MPAREERGVRTHLASAVGIVCVIMLAAFRIPTASGALDQGAWGVAMPIGSGTAHDAKVAFDQYGNAMAVWVQFDGTWDSVWGNRYTAGAGWGTPTAVEKNPYNVRAPRVATWWGFAVAVWAQSDGTRFNIWSNTFDPEAGWGTAELVENDPNDAEAPQVAITDAGGSASVAVVWYQYAGPFESIWGSDRYMLCFFGPCAWATPTVIDTDTVDNAFDPQIAAAPTRDVYIAWYEYDGGVNSNIWAARCTFPLSVGCAAPTMIEANPLQADSPQVAVDANGNAVVAWEGYNGTRWTVWENQYTVGGGWGTPRDIDTSLPGTAGPPQVASNPGGDAVVVWGQQDALQYDIGGSLFVPGRGWSDLTQIVCSHPCVLPQVGIDSRGTAMAVWQEIYGGLYDTRAVRFTPTYLDFHWIETDNLGNATRPAIAVAPGGDAISVWQEADGVRNTIWANRFVADRTPPSLVLTSPTDTLTSAASVTVAGTTELLADVTVNGVPVGVSSVDGSFSALVSLAEGPNAITVIAADGAQNSAAVVRSITRDSTAPTLTIATPVEGALAGASVIRVAGNVSDATSGIRDLAVNGVRVAPNGSGAWSVDLALADGARAITATATDLAGNTATARRNVTVDTIAPSLVLTAPEQALTNARYATVAGATDLGTSVTVNGGAVAVDGSGRFSTAVALLEGPNAITVVATDAAGNAARVARTITLDSTAPVVTITSPSADAATNRSTITVSGTVDDPSATVVVDGVLVRPEADGRWSVTLALREGTNAIAASAVDPAGNRGATVSRTVTYAAPSAGNGTRAAAGSADPLVLGLLGVLIVLSALQFLLYRKLRAKIAEPKAEAESLEVKGEQK